MINFESNNDQAEFGEPQVILGKTCLVLDSALPTEATKREICSEHLQAGRGADMMSSFWMIGCDFEAVAADDGKIHATISCEGLSKITKRCRLTLTQHDSNGKELNKGEWRK